VSAINWFIKKQACRTMKVVFILHFSKKMRFTQAATETAATNKAALLSALKSTRFLSRLPLVQR